MEPVKIDFSQVKTRVNNGKSAIDWLMRLEPGTGWPLKTLPHKLSTLRVAAVAVRRREGFEDAKFRVVEWGGEKMLARMPE